MQLPKETKPKWSAEAKKRRLQWLYRLRSKHRKDYILQALKEKEEGPPFPIKRIL